MSETVAHLDFSFCLPFNFVRYELLPNLYCVITLIVDFAIGSFDNFIVISMINVY
jgi:hypothetical protein